MDPKITKMLVDLERVIANITGHYMSGSLEDQEVLIRLRNIGETMDDRIDAALNEDPPEVYRRLSP